MCFLLFYYLYKTYLEWCILTLYQILKYTIKCNLSLIDPGSWQMTEVESFSPGQVGGDCVILQTAQGDTGVYFLSGAWFRYYRVQWEEGGQ